MRPGGIITVERALAIRMCTEKSMIRGMKPRKASLLEASPLESDASGFEDLFMQHWASVYRLLRRLVGDPAEAEDLALETFLRLHQRSPMQEAGFNAGGWLHRVATNLGLHSIRSYKRRERYELEAGRGALQEAPEQRPPEILAQREEHRLARLALTQMKEQQARLLILRHSGLSYKEIAAILQLAPASIGPLLVRAEREFEKHYHALAQEEA